MTSPALHRLLEKTLPPLQLLRRMHTIIDASVTEVLENATQPLACGEGCGTCCCQPIPATLLEILGLKLYLRHLCPSEVLRSLVAAPASNNCFFLDAAGRCAVYEFRPLACRRFLVLVQRCARGEEPTETRPQHILEPRRSELLRALCLSSEFYVEMGLLPAPPRSMDDFKKVTVLLADTAWKEEIAGYLALR